jgi:glycosyltransferase involved in cell wall biosynthesis
VKVAYVLPSLQDPSGWRTHSIAFLRAICEHVEPALFVAAEDLAAARALYPEQSVFSLPVTQSASLASWRGRGGLLAAGRAVLGGRFPEVDLVHSLEAYPTGLVGSWLARRLNCPHILTAHGTYGVVWHAWPFDRRAYGRVLRGAAQVCPVSHGTARLMREYFGPDLAAVPVRPILNGNDFYQRIPAAEALARAPFSPPVLLTVGMVKPRKGIHLSLAAYARLKDHLPEARYHIAGSYEPNAYYRSLQAFIQERKLDGVAFLGAVSGQELDAQYRGASVFVLTPQQEGLQFEGFGLVYLEAGAYGLPVVGTRSGGVPDAVQDGVTGLMAEPGDVDGVAQALRRLLEDPALAGELGRANRRWAETLTWERTAAQYVQVYREALGRA